MILSIVPVFIAGWFCKKRATVEPESIDPPFEERLQHAIAEAFVTYGQLIADAETVPAAFELLTAANIAKVVDKAILNASDLVLSYAQEVNAQGRFTDAAYVKRYFFNITDPMIRGMQRYENVYILAEAVQDAEILNNAYRIIEPYLEAFRQDLFRHAVIVKESITLRNPHA